jgi:hypothetical protein
MPGAGKSPHFGCELGLVTLVLRAGNGGGLAGSRLGLLQLDRAEVRSSRVVVSWVRTALSWLRAVVSCFWAVAAGVWPMP